MRGFNWFIKPWMIPIGGNCCCSVEARGKDGWMDGYRSVLWSVEDIKGGGPNVNQPQKGQDGVEGGLVSLTDWVKVS